MSIVRVTFNNVGEGVKANRDPRVPILKALTAQPGILGMCEVPILDGTLNKPATLAEGTDGFVGEVFSCIQRKLYGATVPMHEAFQTEGAPMSGLALLSTYPIVDVQFHRLDSPNLRSAAHPGWKLHRKGVLRCKLQVSEWERLDACVLQLPPAHRFGARLDDSVFSGLHQQLAVAVNGADIVMGDYNNRGVSLERIPGLAWFTPTFAVSSTRLDAEEPVDQVLYNAGRFKAVTDQPLVWSDSDHAVLRCLAELPELPGQ